ncbi:MAG: SPOR domain-containing protein [Deltaproteobacteria bacterium]|nr:SPOR domain-containing protein [Deltaproteobacteria bacterium]
MLHDEERLKERITFSLDSRHVFLLFVGAAAVVALVFALGVVVGKRAAPPVGAEVPDDPLALLDKVNSQAVADEAQLSYPEVLAGEKTRAKQPSEKGKQSASDRASAAAAVDGDDGAAGRTQAAAKPAVRPPQPPAPIQPLVAAAAPAKPQNKPSVAAPAKAAAAPPAPPTPGGQTFSLQLSSFQDRKEAEEFIKKLAKSGLRPRLLVAKIADRGTWYRVRVGQYGSWDEALDAKAKFEKSQNLIAYVARD